MKNYNTLETVNIIAFLLVVNMIIGSVFKGIAHVITSVINSL